jgi:hypothetical protein
MTAPRTRVDSRPPVPELQPARVRYPAQSERPRQLERTQAPPVVDHDDPRPGIPPHRRRVPSWSNSRDWTA